MIPNTDAKGIQYVADTETNTYTQMNIDKKKNMRDQRGIQDMAIAKGIETTIQNQIHT